jgi:hypothetical protein
MSKLLTEIDRFHFFRFAIPIKSVDNRKFFYNKSVNKILKKLLEENNQYSFVYISIFHSSVDSIADSIDSSLKHRLFSYNLEIDKSIESVYYGTLTAFDKFLQYANQAINPSNTILIIDNIEQLNYSNVDYFKLFENITSKLKYKTIFLSLIKPIKPGDNKSIPFDQFYRNISAKQIILMDQ